MSLAFSKYACLSLLIRSAYNLYKYEFSAKSIVFHYKMSSLSIQIEVTSSALVVKMHNVSRIWALTCDIYRVLPYRIDFGASIDPPQIRGFFRASFLRDVSCGLHGFAPFLKDVSSGLHLGKVYFPDFGGCLQRNHHSGNLSWHWTGSAIR